MDTKRRISRRKFLGISSAAAAGGVVGAAVVAGAAGYFAGTSSGQQQTKTVTSTTTQSPSGSQTATATQTITTTQTVTASQSGSTSGGLSGTIPMGFLVDLSGPAAPENVGSKEATDFFLTNYNNLMASTGRNIQFTINIEDTVSDPNTALQKVQSLFGRGIKFFLGPGGSSEVTNVKGFSDANKVIFISESSSSPLLAVQKKYIARLYPTDAKHNPVLIRLMKDEGITQLAMIWRGDSFGDGINNPLQDQAKAAGINVLGTYRYDPNATEFSAEVSAMNDAVGNAIKSAGADKVGVQMTSYYSDGAAIVRTAASYPNLTGIKWYGSDGIPQAPDLIKPDISATVEKIHLWTPDFATTTSTKSQALSDYIKSKVGQPAQTDNYLIYDCAWILASSITQADTLDSDKIMAILPQVADNYFGVSGWTELDQFNDRAFADWNIWTVKNSKWVIAGKYDNVSDSITWQQGFGP